MRTLVMIMTMALAFALPLTAAAEMLVGDASNDQLCILNTATGELESVGTIGVYWITGADFDPVSGDLYVCIGGLDTAGALYTLDKETAAATFVAVLKPREYRREAFVQAKKIGIDSLPLVLLVAAAAALAARVAVRSRFWRTSSRSVRSIRAAMPMPNRTTAALIKVTKNSVRTTRNE